MLRYTGIPVRGDQQKQRSMIRIRTSVLHTVYKLQDKSISLRTVQSLRYSNSAKKGTGVEKQ